MHISCVWGVTAAQNPYNNRGLGGTLCVFQVFGGHRPPRTNVTRACSNFLKGKRNLQSTNQCRSFLFLDASAPRALHGRWYPWSGDVGGVLRGANWPHWAWLLPAAFGACRACHLHSGTGALWRRASSVSACDRAGDAELRPLDLGALRGVGFLRWTWPVLHVLRSPGTADRHSCRRFCRSRRRSSRRPFRGERHRFGGE